MHHPRAAPTLSLAAPAAPDPGRIDPVRTVAQMPISAITARPQVRTQFDPEAINELAASIKAIGILQPLLVRGDGKELVLVDGERRLRAAILAGLTEVPVLLIEADSMQTPGQTIQTQLIANLHRRDLNPMELARGLAQLRDESGWTATELAERVGLSLASVSRSLALLDLVDTVQAQVESGQLAASTALKLRKLARDRQGTVAAQAAGLSREGVGQLVRHQKRSQGPLRPPQGPRGSPGQRPPRPSRPLLAVGPLRVHVASKVSPSDVVVALQQLSDLARALSLISPDLPPFLEALRAELNPATDARSIDVSSPVAIDQ